MAAHVCLKNELMEDEKCHNLMSWLITSISSVVLWVSVAPQFSFYRYPYARRKLQNRAFGDQYVHQFSTFSVGIEASLLYNKFYDNLK